MSRMRFLVATMVAALTLSVAYPAGAGVGVISKKNMEWVFNGPQAVGSDIEFLELKQGDGSLKRYAITGSMGNGFNIYDITDPTLAVPAGVFVDPGFNWQGDVQVNPKRKLVVLATQGAIGFTVSHGGSDGLAFVDVSDPAQPKLTGVVNGLGGAAHNSTIIDDEIIYTTGAARMVDYSNAAAPVDRGPVTGRPLDNPDGPSVAMCGGHDITVDPNRPNIVYNACGSDTTQIWEVSDPRQPKLISSIRDTRISIAHQADPSPDGSLLFITDERGGGLTNAFAPGGGVHVYDISGKFVQGASLATPKKLGGYWPPFTGVSASPNTSGPWGNVTAHNMTFQSERHLLSIGWYSMGTWVVDLEEATNDTGPYTEFKGSHSSNGGPTTWGNTQGNILLEGEENWASKWTRFDDPRYDRYIYTNGLTRGMDILRYDGGMPKKIARLAVDETASGGTITGKLDRYAVWTYNGWENRPLANKTLTIKAGGQTVQVTTSADGSFAAGLGLSAGTHEVTVKWAGNGVYRPMETTQTVTV